MASSRWSTKVFQNSLPQSEQVQCISPSQNVPNNSHKPNNRPRPCTPPAEIDDTFPVFARKKHPMRNNRWGHTYGANAHTGQRAITVNAASTPTAEDPVNLRTGQYPSVQTGGYIHYVMFQFRIQRYFLRGGSSQRLEQSRGISE